MHNVHLDQIMKHRSLKKKVTTEIVQLIKRKWKNLKNKKQKQKTKTKNKNKKGKQEGRYACVLFFNSSFCLV